MSDPLYRLARVGLTTPWGVWRLGRGGFDDDCDRCEGTGVTVRRSCRCRAGGANCECSREHGCAHCALRCRYCRGGRVAPPEVYADDFGDAESRAIAEAIMPGLAITEGRRIDMDAPALRVDPLR